MPTNPPLTAFLADIAKCSTMSAISWRSNGLGASGLMALCEGASRGRPYQSALLLAPLCESWMKASEPCRWIESVSARKWGTDSGAQAMALLRIEYAVDGCTWA